MIGWLECFLFVIGAVSDMISEKNEKKKNLLIGERSSVRKSLYSDSAGENLMKRMKLNSKPTFKSMTDDSAETIALSALEDERIKDNDLYGQLFWIS